MSDPVNIQRISKSKVGADLLQTASAAISRIKAAQAVHTDAMLALGRELYNFREDDLWQYTPDPENPPYGYTSFDKWLRSDHELSYSGCRLALQVHETLIVRMCIDAEQIRHVAVGKLQEVIPEITAIADEMDRRISDAEELNQTAEIDVIYDEACQQAATWLADAQSLSRNDLATLRKERRGFKAWTGQIPFGDLPEWLQRHFEPDQPIRAELLQLPVIERDEE